MVAPAATPAQPVSLAAAEHASLAAGLDAAERGETRALTSDELERWAETGELPELPKTWQVASRSSAT